MKLSKRITAAAITLSLSLSTVTALAEAPDSIGTTVVSSAAETSPSSEPVMLLSSITGIDSLSLQSDTVNDTRNEILDKFRDETENFTESINLSKFNIKVYDEPLEGTNEDYALLDSETKKIYETLVYNSPRSYYLMQSNGQYGWYGFDYTFKNDGVYLRTIDPYYYIGEHDDYGYLDVNSVNKEEVAKKQQLLDNEVEYARLFINYGMSDTEKLVALQYFLNLRYDYSYEDFEKPLSERQNNTAIELVENKKGMCVAFATLFNYLAMEVAGITDTGFVTSKDEYGNDYHTWNIIKAATPKTDDKPYWYHIDVTWDNTLNQGYGITSMAYFFLSTEKSKAAHDLFDESGKQTVFAPSEEEIMRYTGEATGTFFDEALWHNSATVMVPHANKWYFILHQSGKDEPAVLYRYDPHAEGDDQYEELSRFKEEWKNGSTVYDHSFTGLGIINGVLYYNCPKHIHSYDLVTNADRETPEIGTIDMTTKTDDEGNKLLPEGYSLFSSYTNGGTLFYGIRKDDNPLNEDVSRGGIYKITDVAVADAKLHDGALVVKIDTFPAGLIQNPPASEPKDVWVTVKNNGELKTVHRKVDSLKDPQSSWFTIPLDEIDPDEPPVLYVWDENMKPYITNFCIGNDVFIHNGKGGAGRVTL